MAHDIQLGQLIDESQQRDAIHIAVAPVVAAEKIYPADDIGFVTEGDTTRVSTAAANKIGIVDPFLKKPVQPEQRFFMFLYPQTITSLRHDWTHPAFESEAKRQFPSLGDPMDDIRDRSRERSEAWLRDFCRNSVDAPAYEHMMNAIQCQGGYGDGGYLDGDHLLIHGNDASGSIPDEFWDHVEIVLGKKFDVRPTYFSCSC
jgi:hypothetical protein